MATVLGPDREYHLFDSFEGLPPATANDGPVAMAWQADKNSTGYHDNCRAEEGEATAAMNLAGAKRFSLHRGWFDKTIAPWATNAPPIAILRLDCDWYDSMKVCLEHLVPRVVPGGIIILDDYDAWDGCSQAVHDYLAATKRPLRIRQFLNGPFYLLSGTTH